jgi:hypothetical protein
MAGHLSYSAISTYLDCPKRFQVNYRQGNRGIANESLIFGTAGHHVVERYLKDRNEDLWSSWFVVWKETLALPNYAVVDWGESSPAECEEIGGRVFSSPEVLDVILPLKARVLDGQPMIEREIHWKLSGLPDILGYIDCIAEDGVPMDFKTAGKMWPDGKAAKELQALFYLAALEQLGEHDHGFKFRHVVITKTKNPRAVIFESQRSPTQILYCEEIVRGVWDGISQALFTPNPTAMWCGESCPIYFSCAGQS